MDSNRNCPGRSLTRIFCSDDISFSTKNMNEVKRMCSFISSQNTHHGSLQSTSPYLWHSRPRALCGSHLGQLVWPSDSQSCIDFGCRPLLPSRPRVSAQASSDSRFLIVLYHSLRELIRRCSARRRSAGMANHSPASKSIPAASTPHSNGHFSRSPTSSKP